MMAENTQSSICFFYWYPLFRFCERSRQSKDDRVIRPFQNTFPRLLRTVIGFTCNFATLFLVSYFRKFTVFLSPTL